jgi:predicted small lipoprotein YifL
MRSLFLLVTLALLMQGCGLRGPLYLPTAEQEREQADRKRRLEERERGTQQGRATEPAPATPEDEEPAPPAVSDERMLPSTGIQPQLPSVP